MHPRRFVGVVVVVVVVVAVVVAIVIRCDSLCFCSLFEKPFLAL